MKPYLSSFGRLFHRFGQLFSPTHWSPWTAIRLEIVQPREKDRERERERGRERERELLFLSVWDGFCGKRYNLPVFLQSLALYNNELLLNRIKSCQIRITILSNILSTNSQTYIKFAKVAKFCQIWLHCYLPTLIGKGGNEWINKREKKFNLNHLTWEFSKTIWDEVLNDVRQTKQKYLRAKD